MRRVIDNRKCFLKVRCFKESSQYIIYYYKSVFSIVENQSFKSHDENGKYYNRFNLLIDFPYQGGTYTDIKMRLTLASLTNDRISKIEIDGRRIL